MKLHALAVLLAVVGLTSALVHQHQVRKIVSKRTKMIKDGSWPAYLRYKAAARAAQGKATLSQPTWDYDDLEYVSNITAGTPKQEFVIVLDTGSANLWVPGTNCNNRPCTGKHKFDTTKSSTFVTNGRHWSIQYGLGSASGVLGEDTVCFGGLTEAQICVPRTTFGLAQTISNDFLNDPSDGILGLAFQSLAVDNVVPPLINAINQGLLDQPIFTVYLQHQGLTENVRGGVFTFGGLDTVNCGPILAYQPLSSATYFQFRMSRVSLGSYSSSTGWEVISDTGTSYIGAPTSVADRLAQQAGATYSSSDDTYYIPCTANPGPLTFTIGSQQYTIQPVNYIVNLDDGPGKCEFAFFGWSSGGFGPSWILGDVFIRQYCNTYDIGQQRVGFSVAKQ